MRAALATILAAAAAPLLALEIPPTPDRYLTDLAGVVDVADAMRVEERLAEFARQSGHQFIVVIFPSLEDENLEDFTIRCAERWKVGRRGLDDGLIFFAFVANRRMRLEVGYGLEAQLPDARVARLLDVTVRPAFQGGDYAEGILALVDAVAGVLSAAPAPAPERQHRDGAPVGVVVLLVALVLLQVLSGGSRLRGRRRGPFVGWWGGIGGGFGGGFGGGGFSPGGGGFGGGGASGSW